MNVSDLGAAVYSPDDGWLVNRGVLMGLQNKTMSMGAVFLADEVVGLVRKGKSITTAKLHSGQQIEASHFVIARKTRGIRYPLMCLICCGCSVILCSIENLGVGESITHPGAVVLRTTGAGDNLFMSTEAGYSRGCCVWTVGMEEPGRPDRDEVMGSG